ncbi:DUF948 domain-containing protein [Alkalicoccus urumqiensis]|uniref:DUF948 domain-containing protein n=1 Tax=Alkalicoccus urumqiensis TaxID=1548213 RepID=A0A2P6MIY3_ALKUR|nr:DUF948 domain-containing protein [Alkalicoccus urumqiensis]PRO66220.1 DUF948 domain-containing protein [Alkalicoccus urumqiensis]
MDWLGIGVLVLAIAIFIGVLFLRPVLTKLAETLGNTAETVSTLNKSLGEITSETTLILYNTNETLVDVNDKIGKLNPLFDIVHDTGEAAHHLTATMASYTSVKHDRAQEGVNYINKKDLEGILRGAAFVYYLRQVKKESDQVAKGEAIHGENI